MKNLGSWVLVGLLMVGASGMPALAMGGGSAQDNAGETVRKLKLAPLDEKNLKSYGWVRITADQLSMGANRLDPDTWYTIYFVNEGEKQIINDEATVHSNAQGEAKFNYHLTEPLGAKWSKLVIYEHTDGQEAVSADMRPVMEAKLR